MSSGPPPVWTQPFVLAVAATASVFTGFYFLIPVLPPFALGLGASRAEVGLIISVYSLAAIPARLLIAPLLDKQGRRAYLAGGLILFGVAPLLYPAAGGFGSLLAIRILHGLSWGCLTTALGALMADIAPPARRGEALGLWGIAPTVAMAIGPATGGILLTSQGHEAVFRGTASLGWLAALLVLFIREPERQPSPSLRGLMPAGALLPAGVLFFSSLSYGSLVAFLPVALAASPRRAAAFFSIYAAAILVCRPFAGRLSDRWGRRAVVGPGLAIGAAGLCLLALSEGSLALGASAVLYGAGIGGGAFPSLMALAIDRSPASSRGGAMAGFFTAYDIAIASGAAFSGPLYAGFGFGAVIAASVAGIALALALLGLSGRGRPRKA